MAKTVKVKTPDLARALVDAKVLGDNAKEITKLLAAFRKDQAKLAKLIDHEAFSHAVDDLDALVESLDNTDAEWVRVIEDVKTLTTTLREDMKQYLSDQKRKADEEAEADRDAERD